MTHVDGSASGQPMVRSGRRQKKSLRHYCEIVWTHDVNASLTRAVFICLGLARCCRGDQVTSISSESGTEINYASDGGAFQTPTASEETPITFREGANYTALQTTPFLRATLEPNVTKPTENLSSPSNESGHLSLATQSLDVSQGNVDISSTSNYLVSNFETSTANSTSETVWPSQSFNQTSDLSGTHSSTRIEYTTPSYSIVFLSANSSSASVPSPSKISAQPDSPASSLSLSISSTASDKQTWSSTSASADGSGSTSGSPSTGTVSTSPSGTSARSESMSSPLSLASNSIVSDKQTLSSILAGAESGNVTSGSPSTGTVPTSPSGTSARSENMSFPMSLASNSIVSDKQTLSSTLAGAKSANLTSGSPSTGTVPTSPSGTSARSESVSFPLSLARNSIVSDNQTLSSTLAGAESANLTSGSPSTGTAPTSPSGASARSESMSSPLSLASNSIVSYKQTFSSTSAGAESANLTSGSPSTGITSSSPPGTSVQSATMSSPQSLTNSTVSDRQTPHTSATIEGANSTRGSPPTGTTVSAYSSLTSAAVLPSSDAPKNGTPSSPLPVWSTTINASVSATNLSYALGNSLTSAANVSAPSSSLEVTHATQPRMTANGSVPATGSAPQSSTSLSWNSSQTSLSTRSGTQITSFTTQNITQPTFYTTQKTVGSTAFTLQKSTPPTSLTTQKSAQQTSYATQRSAGPTTVAAQTSAKPMTSQQQTTLAKLSATTGTVRLSQQTTRLTSLLYVSTTGSPTSTSTRATVTSSPTATPTRQVAPSVSSRGSSFVVTTYFPSTKTPTTAGLSTSSTLKSTLRQTTTATSPATSRTPTVTTSRSPTATARTSAKALPTTPPRTSKMSSPRGAPVAQPSTARAVTKRKTTPRTAATTRRPPSLEYTPAVSRSLPLEALLTGKTSVRKAATTVSIAPGQLTPQKIALQGVLGKLDNVGAALAAVEAQWAKVDSLLQRLPLLSASPPKSMASNAVPVSSLAAADNGSSVVSQLNVVALKLAAVEDRLNAMNIRLSAAGSVMMGALSSMHQIESAVSLTTTTTAATSRTTSTMSTTSTSASTAGTFKFASTTSTVSAAAPEDGVTVLATVFVGAAGADAASTGTGSNDKLLALLVIPVAGVVGAVAFAGYKYFKMVKRRKVGETKAAEAGLTR